MILVLSMIHFNSVLGYDIKCDQNCILYCIWLVVIALSVEKTYLSSMNSF